MANDVNAMLGRLMDPNAYEPKREPQGPRPNRLPGRIGEFFGFGGRNEKPNELTGLTDRRAFMGGLLQDMGGMLMTGQPMQGLAQQQVMQQRLARQQQAQQKRENDIRAMNATSTYLNAVKDDDSEYPSIVKEARYLFPDDPVGQKDYIEKYRSKSGMTIDLGDNYQKELIKQVPEVHSAAMQARDDLDRYKLQEQLAPLLGNTGPTKEGMVSFQAGLNSLGMEGAASLIDKVGEIAGIDFFSGDNGANELYRALSNEDVMSQVREVYPVSDRDIKFIKEGLGTLRINDPRARQALIDRRKRRAQSKLDQWQWYQDSLNGVPGIAPLPSLEPGPGADEYGFGNDGLSDEERAEYEQLKKDLGLD